MLTTRVIPCLLLKGQGLVKTVKFKDPKYVGDPINAVKIFNEKEVDELVFLDITATVEKRKPPFKLISEIASECFMPLSYGGGIRTIEDIEYIFNLGVEKVSINSIAHEDHSFISTAAKRFGSQSIIAGIDIKKNMFGEYEVFAESGTKKCKIDPVQYAVRMQDSGAGEIFLNSIDRDGTGKGYDLSILQKITQSVSIPVIACGGAGKPADLVSAVRAGGASAVAAGSLFVFHGKHRAVLITYPEIKELEKLLSS